MPTLTIDNQSVTVPEGKSVLEAAVALGIVVPHFCYHEALGAVGSCRLCAVTFLEGPVNGVQMACMVAAQDGMVVATGDPVAEEQRSHVIEWLMMNHPHDCPVCDEGGECQLQDMTVAGGHALRRYRGPKRTWRNQELGPFVEQEMNRCIQCYRCLRTYRDYCGGEDFGVFGSRNRLFFGRLRDGALESPFAGNLVDVCPTGVFTSKPYRFTSRHWDLEEAPSICPHCSLGCATVPGGRYRELQRVRAGVNRQVNGFFLCDRGRFGYGHANRPDRPRTPRIDGREVSWNEALAAVCARIQALPPGTVALLGSPRATLEAAGLLRHWAQALGTPHLSFDPHPGRERAARVTAARLGERARSLEDVRRSDLVVVVGADPLAEGPLLALALRQAVRAGGRVLVVDPRPVALPCTAGHLPLAAEQLPAALAALAGEETGPFSAEEAAFLAEAKELLAAAERPILAGAIDLLGEVGTGALFNAAERLSTPERPCGAVLLPGGPNSFGGALLAGAGDFATILDAIEEGQIRALICLEADPCGDHPDRGRAEAALSRLETLVVLDHLPTATAHRADLFLPTAAVAEQDGTFVNFEGRLLPFARVLRPGEPLPADTHPPRVFAPTTPGELPRPAWALLAELLGTEPALSRIRADLASADPRFAPLRDLAPGGEGAGVVGSGTVPPPGPPPFPRCRPTGTLPLLAVEAPYGSELLAAHSAPLEAVRPEPSVLLHPADAEPLGLREGERALLVSDHGRAAVRVRVSAAMAPGAALAPRLRGTPLEAFVPGAVHDATLEKEEEA